ncbi:MAG: hypothetical protein WBX01_00615 [Nitrososphaeraceae archaeon]
MSTALNDTSLPVGGGAGAKARLIDTVVRKMGFSYEEIKVHDFLVLIIIRVSLG